MVLSDLNKESLEKLTQDLKKFLNLELDYTDTETIFTRTGETLTRDVKKPNTPPLISRFARNHGLTEEQLRGLSEHYPPLATVLGTLEAIMKEFVIHHGLLGNYDGNFSKFVLTNTTDMKDTKQVDVRRTDIHKKIRELEADGDPLVAELPAPNETQIPDALPQSQPRAFTLPKQK